MTQKEKLIELFISLDEEHLLPYDEQPSWAQSLWKKRAEQIIKAFPQIEKKPVRVMLLYDSEWSIEKQYYIQGIGYSEQARQDWIDSHYVEVV